MDSQPGDVTGTRSAVGLQPIAGPVQRTSPTFVGMPKFPVAAYQGLNNAQQRHNLRHATHIIRDKRAEVVAEVAGWEELRRAGAEAKDETLTHLADYLVQLEANLTAAGATVHWARDAPEANQIVIDLVLAKQATEVVKVKSMATQEIELNEALEAAGIHAWETDLAELIVQLGHDRPSHILVPAIHRNRSEIRDIFRREMGQVGVRRLLTSPTNPPGSPRRPGCTCARSSCAPRWPSRERTSPSPRPERSWWWSRKATDGCASRCLTRSSRW